MYGLRCQPLVPLLMRHLMLDSREKVTSAAGWQYKWQADGLLSTMYGLRCQPVVLLLMRHINVRQRRVSYVCREMAIWVTSWWIAIINVWPEVLTCGVTTDESLGCRTANCGLHPYMGGNMRDKLMDYRQWCMAWGVSRYWWITWMPDSKEWDTSADG